MNTTLALSSPHAVRIVLLLGALATGCSTAPIMRKTEDLVQNLRVMTRERGERQVADAGSVARDLQCQVPGQSPARIEGSAVLPERPKAGRDINHRLVVAACPGTGDALTGVLTRRFTSQGRMLFEDRETITLKPGRWAIDVFIGIPAQAQPGPYRLDVRFERKGMLLEGASEFAVVAP